MAELNHYEKVVDMLRHPTMYKDIPMLSEIADDIEGLLAACDNYSDTIKELVDEFEKVERKHGKWIFEKGDGKTCVDGWVCSACNCGFHTNVPYFEGFNFCPNCGARMDGKANGTV